MCTICPPRCLSLSAHANPPPPRRLSSVFRVLALLQTAGVLLISSVRDATAQPCPNLCNAHGQCSDPDGVCDCYEGWTGADCSLMICPYGPAWADKAVSVDTAHQDMECSNRGLCNRGTGVCSCEDDRFEGAACERKSCSSDCLTVGRCLSMEYYASQKDPGEGTVYTYEDIWDAEMMYGCVCDDGYVPSRLAKPAQTPPRIATAAWPPDRLPPSPTTTATSTSTKRRSIDHRRSTIEDHTRA